MHFEDDQPELRSAHVIVVGNEKGGAGKSTLSIHLSVALLKAGRRVATIDLDTRQRTLTRFFENRRSWAASANWSIELPFHFAIDRGDSDDVVSKIIADTQYVDFSDVWPMDRSGEAWLLAVRNMVHKLIDAESHVEDLLVASSYADVDFGEVRQDGRGQSSAGRLIGELDEALNDVLSAMSSAVGALHGLVRVMHEQSMVSPSVTRPGASFRHDAVQIADALDAPARRFEAASSRALGMVRRADLIIARIRSMDDVSHLSMSRRAEKIFAAKAFLCGAIRASAMK